MITPAIGTTELYTQLQILIESDTPVFIHGSPGIGKSYIVNDIAAQNNLGLIDVRLSQLDAVDLRGIQFFYQKIQKQKGFYF
jgi:MoxR-like ATPase